MKPILYSVFFFSALNLHSLLSFASPKINDPHHILDSVTTFLSLNQSPLCGEITDYNYATCRFECETSQCKIKECSLSNQENVFPGISQFQTFSCSTKNFAIQFNPALPVLNYQLWIDRSAFSTAERSIQTAIETFFAWTSDTTSNNFDFSQSEFTIHRVVDESYSLQSGQYLPAKHLSGTLKLPIKAVEPHGQVMSLTTQFDLWLGQGVVQSNQFLRFDVDHHTIFQILNTSPQ